jgi:hypothetical protein
MGKPEGIKRLEKLRRRWEDNIKTNVERVEWSSTRFTWFRIGRSGGLL